jgi:predicted enzyme related to lactoylglutathione lyase
MYIDLPVKNLNRAIEFYQYLLNEDVVRINNENAIILKTTTFNPVIRLVKEDSFIPNMFGVLIYLSIKHSFLDLLSTINKLDGKLLSIQKDDETPHQKTTNQSYKAILQDSEGNRIAVFNESGTPFKDLPRSINKKLN